MFSRRLLRKYSVSDLEAAVAARRLLERVEELEGKKAKLLKAVAKLDRKLAILNRSTANGGPGRTPKVGKPGPRRKRWKLSAETRRKMSEAAKRRYAIKTKPDAPKSERKRRSMSPETRRKMAEAARKRWANARSNQAEATGQTS